MRSTGGKEIYASAIFGTRSRGKKRKGMIDLRSFSCTGTRKKKPSLGGQKRKRAYSVREEGGNHLRARRKKKRAEEASRSFQPGDPKINFREEPH